MRLSGETFTFVILLLCLHTNVVAVNDVHDDGGAVGSSTPMKKESLCNYSPLHGISVMDDFPTPEYFHQWFILPGQPVLFKSVLDKMDYPAYMKWTDDYLRKTYGKSKITIEAGKKETRNAEGVSEHTLADFLNFYHDKDIYMVQDVKDKMKDEVMVPRCLRCGGIQHLIDRHIMWFSSGGTRSVLHFDTYDNINCLFDGRKELIFIDKKHKDRVESDGFVEQSGYSSVDVDNVDYEKFPRLKNIPWIKATMEKGDCLFIPRKWYHQVNSLGSRNLAVNLWWVHIPWFNATDCDETTDTPRPTLLSSYPRPEFEERIRLLLLDPFVESSEVNKTEFLNFYFSNETTAEDEENMADVIQEMERVLRRLGKIFDLMDTNNDTILTWPEMMTFNITSLITNYGDVLPFDINEVMEQDLDLEHSLYDEPETLKTVIPEAAGRDEF